MFIRSIFYAGHGREPRINRYRGLDTKARRSHEGTYSQRLNATFESYAKERKRHNDEGATEPVITPILHA